MTYIGHKGEIYKGLSVLNDKEFVSGDYDSTIKIWNINTGN
jgi:hypothetical protein